MACAICMTALYHGASSLTFFWLLKEQTYHTAQRVAEWTFSIINPLVFSLNQAHNPLPSTILTGIPFSWIINTLKSSAFVSLLCLIAQLCLTLCDPMDCSLPGSSVHEDSPGKNTGVGCHALLQGIFPTQGSNPGYPLCKRILYQLSHQGSPRILKWVACPFSSGSSPPRNRTRVSCIAGRFFTNCATREALVSLIYPQFQASIENWLCPVDTSLPAVSEVEAFAPLTLHMPQLPRARVSLSSPHPTPTFRHFLHPDMKHLLLFGSWDSSSLTLSWVHFPPCLFPRWLWCPVLSLLILTLPSSRWLHHLHRWANNSLDPQTLDLLFTRNPLLYLIPVPWSVSTWNHPPLKFYVQVPPLSTSYCLGLMAWIPTVI